MDLFAPSRQKNLDRVTPLAVRMRPRDLDEFVGQRHFLGEGKLLRRMLEADRLMSLLFYGPPGTGKTSLAGLIARLTESHFEQANAASIGVKEVRAVIEAAKERLLNGGKRTVLFLDEIHRFSKSQQDVLLGDVESGVVILIGATTENPFFAVNSALVSRSQIFQFTPITEEDIVALLRRALADKERGYGGMDIEATNEALSLWATWSDGDARRALSALEVAVRSAVGGLRSAVRTKVNAVVDDQNASPPTADRRPPTLTIDKAIAEQSMQRKAIVYDETGDTHYDAISAMIKSVRGSDPDAAVYWVARMLEAGEDPRFIARRLAILASEDIGNADPHALSLTAACYQITERVGMPECQLTLGQTAIYLAAAPKSNASAKAIWGAMKDVREGRTVDVPSHLKDGHYPGAKRLGHGKGYQYPHDDPRGFVEQDYLGVDKTYYEPTDHGFEAEIKRRLSDPGTPDERKTNEGVQQDEDDAAAS